MSDIHNATPKQDELTEEEFIELVLEEQQKHWHKREKNAFMEKPKTKASCTLDCVGMAWCCFSIPLPSFFKSTPYLRLNLSRFQRGSTQEEIQAYKKAVVEISTGSSKGTGFAISPDGLIVTNAHVVEHATTLSVVFPDEGLMEATLIESYPAVDLAFVQVQAEQLPYLPLAEDPHYTVNEHVYFIGNPLAFTGIANEGTLLESIQLEDWQEPVRMLKLLFIVAIVVAL